MLFQINPITKETGLSMIGSERTCIHCKMEIPKSRLEVLPHTETCVKCSTEKSYKEAVRTKRECIRTDVAGRRISSHPKMYRDNLYTGKARHSVSFHDGIKINWDGSPFFDLRIFKRNKDKATFIRELEAAGYIKCR